MADAKLQLVTMHSSETLVDTLNANGAAAVSLDIDSDDFVRQLDVCVSKWFESMLIYYLAQPAPPSPYRDTQQAALWEKGHGTYHSTDAATRAALDAALINAFDPGACASRAALFGGKRKRSDTIDRALERLGLEDASLVFYIESVLVLVKQGGAKMALGGGNKPVEKWTHSGFGFWAQIVPSQGIRSQLALRQVLRGLGFDARLKGLPHVIYKPERGDALATHTDGPRLGEMIDKLEAMHADLGKWPTNYDWCTAMGLQCLVHHKGGLRDGATYSIGPMTPHKLHVCLTTLRNSPNEATKKEYLATANPGKRGPAFLKWGDRLGELNAALRAHGLGTIGLMPICPETSCDGTFAALWPVGFPHGSHANASRRVTTTAPLSIFRQVQVDGRVPDRVHALAALAATETSDAARERARDVVRGQTVPFEGGSTHVRPDAAIRWYDCRSEAGGYFAGIAPTRCDAELFQSVWDNDHTNEGSTAAGGRLI